MKHIIVGGVETFSTVDFPNVMAAVVFMQGCPWRCPFCHNKSLQKIGENSNFLWEKFLDFLKKCDSVKIPVYENIFLLYLQFHCL